jgi:hypothetical protein
MPITLGCFARWAAMRARYGQWEAGIGPIPPDAVVSQVYDRTTLAQP